MEFSIGACLRFGWDTFKKRPWFLVGIAALLIVLNWLIGAVASAFGSAAPGGLIGAAINLGLSALLSMGFTAAMLKSHDSLESAEAGDLWHPQPFWKFIGAELLTMVVVLIGFVLLIVPGVIAILALFFVPYLVVERQLGPVEALKESRRISAGYRWDLLGLLLAVLLINILGALALLVGLLVSVPVTALATVHAYRLLSAKADAIVPENA